MFLIPSFYLAFFASFRVFSGLILNLNPAVELTTKSEKSQSQKIKLKGTPTNWVKGFF